jgi:membrane protease subunit (stomatin/prohibitin family)
MGLIKAAKNAIGSTLRDQYKEYFECPALSKDVLVVRARKKTFAGGTNRGDDNVITDGSVIAVADGQCMIIVEDGRIVDFCVGDSQAQTTGRYIYKTGTAPSMLTAGFEGLKKSFQTVWGRIQTGGQIDSVQRVYYVNMLEIMNNKFGVGNIHFRDSEFGFTVNFKCHGKYSYKIVDPIMFYSRVCGNVTNEYRRNEDLDSQLKSEIVSVLGDAVARVADLGVRYDQIRSHTSQIKDAVNEEIREEWIEGRGIAIEKITIDEILVDDESAKKIEEFQTVRFYSNPLAAAGLNAMADAEAKKLAAQNAGGAHIGFMNYNLAQQASSNTQQLFGYGQQQMQVPQVGFNQQPGFSQQGGLSQQAAPNQEPYQQQKPIQENPAMNTDVGPQGGSAFAQEEPSLEAPVANIEESPAVAPASPGPSNSWACNNCNAENMGKFCMECGSPAPVPVQNTNCWKCINCSTENSGKFCMECGTPKPLDSKCESCGFEGTQPFKFCPECGQENLI